MKTLIHALVIFSVLTCVSSLEAQRGGPAGPRIEPEDMKFDIGVGEIKDRESFENLSYQGPEVSRDAYLANLEFVKFCIDKADPKNHKVYFMNTQNHRAHPPWMRLVGINTRERGALVYLPRLTNPSGGAGLYIFDFQPNDSYGFEDIKRIQDLLISKMPILKGRIAFHPLQGNVAKYEDEKSKYEAAKVAVYLDSDLYKDISFLPLNPALSFGVLRVFDNKTRPSPRDIVICETLPNQMPRVAGVISETRQTPLSHVNLRAIQDDVPNAFINAALKQPEIRSLIGKLVCYEVTPQGYKIREATKVEVDKHFASLRPAKPQTPARDLTQHEIRPLSKIKFENSPAFGAKAANLATLHTIELPAGTIPDGFGVPFYFYDEFVKHNGIDKDIDAMLADPKFLQSRELQIEKLTQLREAIENAKTPAWMLEALAKTQKSFPSNSPIRCRSSTNNEDLPDFSGAGLYDSFTHNTDEGHLSKSIKQVYASLWNFRAFEEREFYRIDHKSTAMGVLLHPNFENEKANGVAVTDDILYETQGNYYLNTQIGENLVTNPNQESSPEETLLGWWEDDGHEIVRRSIDAGENDAILSKEHLAELRDALGRIHLRFKEVYGKTDRDQFSMEIEFKITKDDKLIIKQARPWVY